jgi:pseudouridine kinase
VGRALPDDAALAAAMREVQAQGARDIIVTRGARGVLVTNGDSAIDLPAPPADVVDVTGAGDAFAAAVCWSLVQGENNDDLVAACRRGLHLSALTLGVPETVHPGLGPDSLTTEHPQQQD